MNVLNTHTHTHTHSQILWILNMFYSLISTNLTWSLVLENIRGNFIPINSTWITWACQPKVPNICLILDNVKFYKALWKIAIFVSDCDSSHKLSSTTCFFCCTFKHKHFFEKSNLCPSWTPVQARRDGSFDSLSLCCC